MLRVTGKCGGSCDETSEGSKRSLDLTQLAARYQASPERLLRALSQELRGKVALGAVVQRAAGAGGGNRAEPGSLLGRDVGVM